MDKKFTLASVFGVIVLVLFFGCVTALDNLYKEGGDEYGGSDIVLEEENDADEEAAEETSN